jgi:hypothetical protein
MTKSEYLVYVGTDDKYLKYGRYYEVKSRWTDKEEYVGYDKDSVETSYTAMVNVLAYDNNKRRMIVLSRPEGNFIKDIKCLQRRLNDDRMRIMQSLEDLKARLKLLDNKLKLLTKGSDQHEKQT